MSHLHIQRLARIRDEYEEVRNVVTQALQDTSRSSFGILKRADLNLEATYITRLFAEFEGILREYLFANDPRGRCPRESYNRINRVARLVSIHDNIRDKVHEAREYRNSVVHPGESLKTMVSLGTLLSRLNKFLAPLR